jgi:exodeoxyribonuclease-3
VTLRLLSFNIRRGGADRVIPIGEVIAACEPHIVVLQEATDPSVVEALAQRLSMAWGARRGQSLAFLSRMPLEHHAWHRPRISRHAFVELQPEGVALRIFGVHLSAVHAAWTERRRALEFRALLRTIAAHQHGRHVIVGDFNTVAPGELLDVRQLPARLRALVWLSGGQIRYRTIKAVLEAGYADAFRGLHPDLPGATFPTWSPHVRLDYLFVPSAWAPDVRTCEVVTGGPARDASDHFALLTTIAT